MAGAKPKIEVTGARELNRALKKAAGRADALKEIHKRLAVPLVAAARGEAPTRSGTLAATVRASASKRALGLRAGGARVPYAGPIHFGWPRRGITPNPFLIRARDSMAAQLTDAYTRHVNELTADVLRESS